MSTVALKQISKSYDGETDVVKDLSLDVGEGEFVVLVGPSGCGKSTTLRMVAGLEEITAGKLLINDRVVNKLPPKDRNIAMVFQNYALYPHMTVYKNMAFGLKLKKVPKKQIRERVNRAAEIVGMSEYLDRRPKALSGGQRQRVALGRAIVRNPSVFLFDEPLSNLDAKLRVQMRIEIASLQRKLGVTTIYVTHDQTEAMTMADRIAVMDKGVLQQYDNPMALYNRPANLFVADFIGSPSMNLFHGLMREDRRFETDDGSLEILLPASTSGRLPQKLVVGIRPEHFSLKNDRGKDAVELEFTVRAVEPLGNESFIYVEKGTHKSIMRVPDSVHLKMGEVISAFADPEQLHYFDMETGEAIYL